MWSVLTDYDRLTEYVPNLDVCKRLKGGTKTRYRLKQAGCSQSLFLRMEAQAVLDVQEEERTMGRKELRFSMVESENFKVRTLLFLIAASTAWQLHYVGPSSDSMTYASPCMKAAPIAPRNQQTWL